MKWFAPLSIGLLLIAACEEGPMPTKSVENQDIDISLSWEVAEPAEVGMSETAVDAAIVAAGAIDRMLSLVVIKNGRLVVDHYQHGGADYLLNDVRSITKSMVSTLAGLALYDGDIVSLDDPMLNYFKPELTIDSTRATITVRQLLSMSTGLYWNETSSTSYGDWRTSGDAVGYVLRQSLVNPPGSAFMYNSGTSYLLGLVVEGATGMPIPDIAAQRILEPLGIETVNWEYMSDGTINGAAGFKIRSRDMARIGQLFLQNGKSGDLQILPEGWVADATESKFLMRVNYGPATQVSYGYLWWTNETIPNRAFMAWGYGGQFIYVVPNHHLVVVTTSSFAGLSDQIELVSVTQAILTVIIDGMVAAVIPG